MSDSHPDDATAARDPADAILVFHEQADGRKVSHLPGGKVVLIDLKQVDRVGNGEAWFVRLRHRETFAIADPVERVTRATLESASGAPANPLADTLHHAHAAEPRQAPVLRAAVLQAAATLEAGPATEAPLRDRDHAVDIARLVRPSDRVALFVDGANTDGSARAAGYFVDFRRAREFFVGSATFYAAFYYVADFTASDPMQQRFFDFLSHVGYIVRRRPVKVIHDPDTGDRIIKGNLDTEIVLDMLNTVDNYDVAFLFSGDSDFERAVDLLRSRGKRLFVVSSRAQLSRELAYIADKPIVYLEAHAEQLARSDRVPSAG